MKTIYIILTYIIFFVSDIYSPYANNATINKEDVHGDFSYIQKNFKKYYGSNPDTAFYFALQLKDKAEQLNDPYWHAISLKNLGFFYDIVKNNFELAIVYYMDAAEKFKELGKYQCFEGTLNNIGRIYMMGNDFEYALETYQEALKAHDFFTNDTSRIRLYRNLGRCLTKNKKYDDASFYYNEAFKLNEPIGDKKMASVITNLIGAMYLDMGRFDTARMCFIKAVEYSDNTLEEQKLMAIAQNNIGESFLSEGNLDKAEEALQKAIDLKLELEEPNFTISSYLLYAQLLLKKGKYTNALELLEKGLANVQMIGYDKTIYESLGMVIDILNKLNHDGKEIDGDTWALYSQNFKSQANYLADLKTELLNLNGRLLKLNVDNHKLKSEVENKSKQINVTIGLIVALTLSLLTIAFLLLKIYQLYKKRGQDICFILDKVDQATKVLNS